MVPGFYLHIERICFQINSFHRIEPAPKSIKLLRKDIIPLTDQLEGILFLETDGEKDRFAEIEAVSYLDFKQQFPVYIILPLSLSSGFSKFSKGIFYL